MFDFEIARYFYKMASIKKHILDEEYSAKAYYAAAYAIDSYEAAIETHVHHGESLTEIPHIGKKLASAIHEIVQTHSLEELLEYEKRFLIKDYDLLLSHGLPQKILKKLVSLSINNLSDLLVAWDDKGVRKRFSDGEYRKVRQFIADYHRLHGEYLLAYGVCLGNEICDFLKQLHGVHATYFSEEFQKATGKIREIAIICNFSGDFDSLWTTLKEWSRVKVLPSEGERILHGITEFGIPVTIQFADSQLSQSRKQHSSMKIMGDLHAHSDWSDGLHSIQDMAIAAEKYGYQYFSITDHSVSEKIANGLSENQALDEIKVIKQWNKHHTMKLLAGIEVDILSDGSLDYSDEILSQFDFVVAAIHTHMNQSPIEMEKRLDRALSNPNVNILAHPTGRLLGRPGILFSERKPYLSEEVVVRLCCKHHVVLEVNCFPERLDLNQDGIVFALQQGGYLSLGTDSHSVSHLSNIKYGVRLLNQIEVNEEHVLNTFSYRKLQSFFRRQRLLKGTVLWKRQKASSLEKNFSYYFDANKDIRSGRFSVVGIDLTGSERKASGWCYLRKNETMCNRVYTDEEIMESITHWQPDIISIDSPLAYPKGRDCYRKDCPCSKFGIMRESERMLRHFGVPIYPCLIDSMVNLTTRGMRLAKTLRTKGYTVIESYPGVAQDILHIPRKGKTKEQHEHLRKGLISFGLIGDLIDVPALSHDELDAITSALVGYFYANGQYVAMGNDSEDYLIVPRVKASWMQQRLVIGFSGEICAGKTTITEYLRFKYGIPSIRYSQMIQCLYHVFGREDLQKTGAAIAQDEVQQRLLTQKMITSMGKEPVYVVDGLRHMEDYQELKRTYGQDFKLIHVFCKSHTRYKRYMEQSEEQVSEQQFFAIDNHESEKDIGLLNFVADYQIDNSASYKNLFKQVDMIMELLTATGG